MKQSQESTTLPWLLPSLGLGCMVSWFWVSADRLEFFIGGDWAWSYLAPAVFAAILLPGLGAVADLRRANGMGTSLAGSLTCLILLISGGDGPSESRLGPLVIIGFLCTLLYHFGSLPIYARPKPTGLPGKGLAAILGLVLISSFCAFVWGFQLPFKWIFLIGSLLLFGIYLVLTWDQEGLGIVPDWPDVMAAIRTYPRQHSGFTDTRNLLLFMLLFASGIAQLMFTVWSSVTGNIFIMDIASFIYLFLGLVIFGTLSSMALSKTFGNRRLLILSSLFSTALVIGLYLSRSDKEVMLMVGCLAFLLGITWSITFELLARITPRELTGQTFGYALLAVTFGILLGKALQLSYRADVPPFGNICVFLLALAISLAINPNRALRAQGGTNEENPRDVAWDWIEEPVEGLARHTLLSAFVRFIARSLAEIFFGRFRIIGRENLLLSKGAIIVANHPNTFFDPLLITAITPGRLHYWAKSTLWAMPMAGSILDRMGAIPVYRRQDHARDNSSGNLRTLALAADKINQGAHMLIFPEGVSQVGLSLKPIKTGAARLGFQAMKDREWSSDIKIIPIGIDYEEPSLFRGGVTIRIGEPVGLADYREAFESNERGAVRAVTAKLTDHMTELLPHLDEPGLEVLVHQIQSLYGERVLHILGEHDDTAARKRIVDAVNHYQSMDPDAVYLFSRRMEMYEIERERLATPENHPPIPFSAILKILVSMFSLASFGLLTNWLPYRMTGKMVDWLNVSPVWVATFKLTIGSIVFGIYYIFIGALLTLTLGPIMAGILLFCVIFAAFVALGALDRFAFRFSQFKTLWQAFWTQDTNEDLDKMKVSLIHDLERFREAYSFYEAREIDP